MVDRLLTQISPLQSQVQVILVLVLVVFLLFLLQMAILFRVRGLSRRYSKLLGSVVSEGDTLESVLFAHLDKVKLVLERIKALEMDCRCLENITRISVQNVAVIRFNAFPDTGSDLSFALALLDQGGNGVVLSSLYGRNESRIYAKPVQRGVSTYHLTEEEKAVIKKALGKSSELIREEEGFQ